MTDTQDEFAQTSGYSKDRFYTASTDGRGNGKVLHVQVASSVAGELGALVAMQVIPDYRTAHDIVRDSIVHRIHDLQDMVKDPAAVMRLQALSKHTQAVNGLIEIERWQQTIRQMQTLAYTVDPAAIGGQYQQLANTKLEGIIALLDDRPDLQAILRAKLT